MLAMIAAVYATCLLMSIGVPARGLGMGVATPRSGKAVVFRAGVNFFGQKLTAEK